MEKVFSARMDEAHINRLNKISELLHASKKATLEKAIDLLWGKVDSKNSQAFSAAFGIWGDKVQSTETISNEIKKEFRKSYERHNR